MNAENVDVDHESASAIAKEMPTQEIKNTKNSAFCFDVTDYEELSRQLKESSAGQKNPTKHEDKAFMPTASSICTDLKMTAKYKYGELKWKRLGDMAACKGAKLFDGPAAPEDVQHGILKLHPYLSAVSALAEKPGRIEKLFVSEEASEHGMYALSLTKHGQRQQVIIDDQVPSDLDGNPAFARCSEERPVLWPILLEKALAKLNGNYDNLRRVSTAEILHDLTGAPSYDHELQNNPDVFLKLMEGYESKFVMTVSLDPADDPEKAMRLQSMGLDPAFSFTINKAARIKNKVGKIVQLVKVRNPWGDTVRWDGDWSDNSACWTPLMRKQANQQNDDRGHFWMEMADLEKHFTSVQICKYVETSQFCHELFEHQEEGHNASVLRFRMPTASLFTISLSQVDRIRFPEDSGYRYSRVRLILAKVLEEDRELAWENVRYLDGVVSGADGAQRETCIEERLLKDTSYVLVVEVDWEEKFLKMHGRQFSINAYGPAELSYTNESQIFEAPYLVRQIVLSMYKKDYYKTQKYQMQAPYKIHKFALRTTFGYLAFLFQNSEQFYEFNQYLQFEPKDVYQVQPFNENNRYSVSLEPGQERLILIKYDEEGAKDQQMIASPLSMNIKICMKAVYERCIEQGDLHKLGHSMIYAKKLMHPQGIVLVYCNDSADKGLHEVLEVELTGSFEIEHQFDQSRIEFTLAPGTQHRISIKRTSEQPGGYRILSQKSEISPIGLMFGKLQASIDQLTE